MNTKKDGFQQCYNAQIAVDAKEQIIVAVQVEQSASDVSFLVPMIERTKENTGKAPKVVLADAGYKSEGNFQSLEEDGIRGYIPLGREGAELRREPDPGLEATCRMRRRMASRRGKVRYRKRKHIAEPPFGWIKGVLGFRRFLLRGLPNVRGEWNLVALGVNLRRMGTNWAWA